MNSRNKSNCRFIAAVIRKTSSIVKQSYQDLSAIQKAFPKALAPVDIDDTTECRITKTTN